MLNSSYAHPQCPFGDFHNYTLPCSCHLLLCHTVWCVLCISGHITSSTYLHSTILFQTATRRWRRRWAPSSRGWTRPSGGWRGRSIWTQVCCIVLITAHLLLTYCLLSAYLLLLYFKLLLNSESEDNEDSNVLAGMRILRQEGVTKVLRQCRDLNSAPRIFWYRRGVAGNWKCTMYNCRLQFERNHTN